MNTPVHYVLMGICPIWSALDNLYSWIRMQNIKPKARDTMGPISEWDVFREILNARRMAATLKTGAFRAQLFWPLRPEIMTEPFLCREAVLNGKILPVYGSGIAAKDYVTWLSDH